MKNLLQKIGLTIFSISIILLLVNCGDGSGGGSSSNKYLGELPGIAKDYVDQIDGLKKDLKESTDREEYFSLDKEIDLLEEESDKAIEEYLASNPIKNLPFEQKANYGFTIKEVSVHPKYSSSASRLQLIAKVTFNEDLLNEYGGFTSNFFAYVIAVDKEGNSLTRKHGVMMNYNIKGPFKANMEAEAYGSLDGPADLVNFEKFVFLSKEELKK